MITQQKSRVHALQWYIDQGVDEALLDRPQNRLVLRPVSESSPLKAFEPRSSEVSSAVIQGRNELYSQAVALASGAQTLEELKAAIFGFDGIPLKKTATNMVFSDGNPDAFVMVIGEVPGAEEDRLGKAFVGEEGQMLDRILQSIGLDRRQTEPSQSVYISNVLNWRPPGNRKPLASEIELSLPFIERHIQLVKPKILIFCGGLVAQALLEAGESISKLRKSWHEYRPRTALPDSGLDFIPAIVTYPPAYLLKTPLQKRAVWADMLEVFAKRKALGISH